MATQELSPIRWAKQEGQAITGYWSLYEYKIQFHSGCYLPIYNLPQNTGTIEVRLKGGNFPDSSSQYVCYIFGLIALSGGSTARTKLLEESNRDGRFSLTLDGTDYHYIAVLANYSNAANSEVDVDYVRLSDGSQGSDPTPRTVKISANPSSPNGTINYGTYPEFTWRVSTNIPDGVTYKGTYIQVTTVTDTSWSNLWVNGYASGNSEYYRSARTFSPDYEYMWRTKADIEGTPSDSSVVLDPDTYSTHQTFRVNPPEEASISNVSLSSPENERTFYFGNSISLSWSISKTSNINVDFVELYIDDKLFGDQLKGNVTSKTLSSDDLASIGAGSHEWYVKVYPDVSSGSGNVVIAPGSYGKQSDTRTFKIDYNTGAITVELSSPYNNQEFVKGSEISFQWRINKNGSNVNIVSSELYISGSSSPYTTITGTGTSYNVRKDEINKNQSLFGAGTHSWWVRVNYEAPQGTNVSVVYVNSSFQYVINERVAEAQPSSPGTYSSSGQVDGNTPVDFKWSLSQNGDSSNPEEYTGSDLEYRYSTDSDWSYLGHVDGHETVLPWSKTSLKNEKGFRAHTTVHWRVKTSLGGRPATFPANKYATFTVGDEKVQTVTISLLTKGNVNGAEPIEFAWAVDRKGQDDIVITGTQIEYSVDGKKSWINPEQENSGVILGNDDTYSKSYNLELPADTIYWHVRVKTNSTYSDWVEGSFTVHYDAYGNVAADVSVCPVSAGFRRDLSSKFAANLSIEGRTTESIVFKDAQFCWKMANGSEYAVEEMTVNGQHASISFTGFKFSVGILNWYIKATDSKDNDSETIIFTSYVLSSSIDSFPIRPKLSYIDMGQQIQFEWGFISANGQSSITTEICFSRDGKNYDDIVTLDNATIRNGQISTNAELLTLTDLYSGTGVSPFNANYFSPGIVHWKIRSFNSDSVIGEWSEPASFIVTGTTQPLDLICDEKPFATLQWSIAGQIAYQIRIDDTYGYGPFHGEDQSFTFPEPLLDGTHTFSVRGQNQLGQWGPWTSVLAFVQNQPSVPHQLNLHIDADVDAVLQWSPVIMNADDEFLIYRDGKLIARLVSGMTSYMDRLALGEHKYRIIQRLPDGNYNEYTRSSVTMSTDVTKITLLRGGSWIDLLLTSEQYPQNSYTHSRVIAKSKIMGTKHQVIEVSEFEENNGEFKFCWPYYLRAQSKLFDSLVGQAVIIKSRGEQVICGVLESCNMTISSQIVECDFSLEQMSVDTDLSIAVKPDDMIDMMTNLDTIYFGQMNAAELAAASTNPGYTNPRWYEDIAEAINEKLAESGQIIRQPSDMSTGI